MCCSYSHEPLSSPPEALSTFGKNYKQATAFELQFSANAQTDACKCLIRKDTSDVSANPQ